MLPTAACKAGSSGYLDLSSLELSRLKPLPANAFAGNPETLHADKRHFSYDLHPRPAPSRAGAPSSWACLLWTWIGLMNPHKLTWGFAYDFPFAMIVGVVTILAILISSEPKKLPLAPPVKALLAFNLWMTITTIFFSLFPECGMAAMAEGNEDPVLHLRHADGDAERGADPMAGARGDLLGRVLRNKGRRLHDHARRGRYGARAARRVHLGKHGDRARHDDDASADVVVATTDATGAGSSGSFSWRWCS